MRMRTSYFLLTEPSVWFDITCFICGGTGCNVQALGLIEMGAGQADPDVLRTRRSSTPRRSGRVSASACGIELIAMFGTGCPTCARSGRTT